MLRGFQGDEDCGAKVERTRIEEGDRLPDDPIVLQALDAPPAGGLGQADAVGDGGRGQRTILLQQVQNSLVELVHNIKC